MDSLRVGLHILPVQCVGTVMTTIPVVPLRRGAPQAFAMVMLFGVGVLEFHAALAHSSTIDAVSTAKVALSAIVCLISFCVLLLHPIQATVVDDCMIARFAFGMRRIRRSSMTEGCRLIWRTGGLDSRNALLMVCVRSTEVPARRFCVLVSGRVEAPLPDRRLVAKDYRTVLDSFIEATGAHEPEQPSPEP